MKKILLITTGGTIASIKTDTGLLPGLVGEQLLEFIPNIKNMCTVDIKSLFSIDSTNIYYKHWLRIAEEIKSNYDKYDGFIICHGTDTMSYTASALSYLIQDSKKPIVLTGAQKPINLDISDAKTNLYDSFTYVCDSQASGVVLIFNGNVILGTRARKVRTKSFDAFSSIDYPKVAIVKEGQVIPYITNLSKDTKFLKGDGFVLEQCYNVHAAKAQQESAFNRAFANNEYAMYASQGVYLNDNIAFIDKPKGRNRYTCTLKYNNVCKKITQTY